MPFSFTLTIKLDAALQTRFDRLLDLLERQEDLPGQQAALNALTARLATSRSKLAATMAAATPSSKS